jgi:large subunit ribosomal protein L15
VAEVRLRDLAKIAADTIDLEALKGANLIRRDIRRVRIIASGALERPVTLRGLYVTKGCRAMIEAAGGRIIEDE